MSQITIQCRLVASESTRKLIWQLMAEKNTPLINEILWQINNHPNFEQWQSEGKLPSSLVSDWCKSLKKDPLYAKQPSRFYLSITKLVNYIYKSWLKLQQRRQYGRLIEYITNQASKLGIAIAEVKQPVRGSPNENALSMAIALYNKKNKT